MKSLIVGFIILIISSVIPVGLLKIKNSIVSKLSILFASIIISKLTINFARSLGLISKYTLSKNDITVIFIATIVLIIFHLFIRILYTKCFGELLTDSERVIEPLIKKNSMILIFLIIVSPIVEETLFRGILINKQTFQFSTIVVSNLLFSIIHGDTIRKNGFRYVFNFVMYFTLSSLLAIIYLTSESLFVPIYIHGINNLISIILIIYSIKYKEEYKEL